MQTVAVLGGGVAGMTVAQELAERGFSVTLVEAQPQLGGRQRHADLLRSPWRHLRDTLSRVPSPYGGHLTDHLRHAPQTMLARAGAGEVLTVTQLPEDVGALYEGLRAMLPYALGLDDQEVAWFTSRLQVLLGSCQQRRAQQWERTSWWDFLQADRRSAVFQSLLARGLSGAITGLPPARASASAVGYALLQHLLQGTREPALTWRGPGQSAWWAPWQRHLLHLGVDLRLGTRAVGLRLEQDRVVAARLEDGAPYELEADHFVLALPVGQASAVLGQEALAVDRSLAQLRWLARHSSQAVVRGSFWLGQDVPVARGQVLYLDHPWGLRSVSPGQFWDRGVSAGAGLLRVVAQRPDLPDAQGRALLKVPPEQRAALIWQVLQAHLNDGEVPVLPEGYQSAHIEAPYVGFVPTPGVAERLPQAQTRLANLALAGLYVRCAGLVHGPERANEAARRAANAVLRSAGVRARPCTLWVPHGPAAWWVRCGVDKARWRLGLPHVGVV